MPFSRGARELEGGVHHIRLEAHHICHALHKEGVPTAEGGDWQDAYPQLPIKAPAQGNKGQCESGVSRRCRKLLSSWKCSFH